MACNRDIFTFTFYLSLYQFRDSPNIDAQVPYLYPPGTGWPGYNPRHWVPFSLRPTNSRATAEVSVIGICRYDVQVVSRFIHQFKPRL
jgi:hypothetical protein